jgi:hypothetical protein
MEHRYTLVFGKSEHLYINCISEGLFWWRDCHGNVVVCNCVAMTPSATTTSKVVKAFPYLVVFMLIWL